MDHRAHQVTDALSSADQVRRTVDLRTLVLGTKKGRGVRADYRVTSAARGERYVWEQRVEETPFEKIVRSAEVAISLEPHDEATAVTLTTSERLKGLSRLGAALMRGAAKRRLDDALEGIDRALVGEGG